jgi:hypothetical protein
MAHAGGQQLTARQQLEKIKRERADRLAAESKSTVQRPTAQSGGSHRPATTAMTLAEFTVSPAVAPRRAGWQHPQNTEPTNADRVHQINHAISFSQKPVDNRRVVSTPSTIGRDLVDDFKRRSEQALRLSMLGSPSDAPVFFDRDGLVEPGDEMHERSPGSVRSSTKVPSNNTKQQRNASDFELPAHFLNNDKANKYKEAITVASIDSVSPARAKSASSDALSVSPNSQIFIPTLAERLQHLDSVFESIAVKRIDAFAQQLSRVK